VADVPLPVGRFLNPSCLPVSVPQFGSGITAAGIFPCPLSVARGGGDSWASGDKHFGSSPGQRFNIFLIGCHQSWVDRINTFIWQAARPNLVQPSSFGVHTSSFTDEQPLQETLPSVFTTGWTAVKRFNPSRHRKKQRHCFYRQD